MLAAAESVTAELADQVRTRPLIGSLSMCCLPLGPAAFLLDTGPASDVDVKEGPKDLVLADEFALVPFWKADESAPETGKEYRAVVVLRQARSSR